MGLTMETYSGIMIEWSLLLIFNEKGIITWISRTLARVIDEVN